MSTIIIVSLNSFPLPATPWKRSLFKALVKRRIRACALSRIHPHDACCLSTSCVITHARLQFIGKKGQNEERNPVLTLSFFFASAIVFAKAQAIVKVKRPNSGQDARQTAG
ncbi:MAG: hypothetical protein E6868_07025 [Pantoea sp.]|uniref:hypothetical protein n=1 Tax=Pantoea TaxID=53335 RepID=UPI0028A6D994|nr:MULTISPECIES: hypothetical protein [Pantoea]MDU1572988.1 hypothetical protein [Pantoea sp.]